MEDSMKELMEMLSAMKASQEQMKEDMRRRQEEMKEEMKQKLEDKLQEMKTTIEDSNTKLENKLKEFEEAVEEEINQVKEEVKEDKKEINKLETKFRQLSTTGIIKTEGSVAAIKIKVPTYDGKVSWNTYLRQFEAVVRNWREEEKATSLIAALRGEALEAQLRNRKQRFEETLQQYEADVSRMVNLAYSTAPAEVIEQLSNQDVKMKKTHTYLDDSWTYQILEKYKNRRHSKNSTFNKTRGIRCWTCGAEGHLRSRCRTSDSDGENPSGSYITRVQERRPMVCYSLSKAPPLQKIPLQCNGASLAVPGRVCGRECKMIVDTGSSHTIVRPNIVAHCKMQDTQEKYLLETARGEVIPVKLVHLAEIKISTKPFKQKCLWQTLLMMSSLINNEEVHLNVLKTEVIPTRRVRIVEDATLLPEPEVPDELKCNHQDSKNKEVLVVELQSKLRRPRELVHHRRGNKECADDNLQLNYHLTQFLTGQGSFRKYTEKIRKTPNGDYRYCGGQDTPSQMVLKCSRWERRRLEFPGRVGEINDGNTVNIMLQSRETWRRSSEVISGIMTWKIEGKERPAWQEISNRSPTFKGYWALWDSLAIENNLLKRVWESPDGKKATTVLPRKRVPEVLHGVHSGVGGGHFGIKKTLVKVKERFYWLRSRSDVEEWCRRCETCAASK
ncbi:hypothetical protein NQ315_002492 [Exocentrus adspersus]|uniref:RNA-directed DNA polymerase n=1 Tax=Exocentrus adspersus TaxID=1586481 RepID=A0AAV8VL50_9CUCU|nr:hypothetical protein NQ315_002492 [Exocentrus adspersus]